MHGWPGCNKRRCNMVLLTFDVTYLCFRSFYITKRDGGRPSAPKAVSLALAEFEYLESKFEPDRMVFCFESSYSLRREIYPDYKRNRRERELDQEEKEALQELGRLIELLRTDFLPIMGYKNLFCLRGYESDDIMAQLSLQASRTRDVVILVTDDSDLFQCLGPQTIIYSLRRRKIINDAWLKKTHQVTPRQWARMKELAGCSTDDVPGVPGVGSATAQKYVLGQLPLESKAYQSILNHADIRERNRKLVTLPFEGMSRLEVQEDDICRDGWVEVFRQLKKLEEKNERCPV